MTEMERRRVRALGRARIFGATATARFVRDLARIEERAPETELSARQAAFLVRIAHRFRRQLPAELVPGEGELLFNHGGTEGAEGEGRKFTKGRDV